MDISKTIERFQLIHKLITDEKTNTPDLFAERLGISRAFLYQIIDELKQKNLPIVYSRKKKSFIYTKTVNLKFEFVFEILENDEDLKNTNGGEIYSDLTTKYVNGKSLIFLNDLLKE